MQYSKFLQSKQFTFAPSDIKAEQYTISPMLYDFQRDITNWALQKGKACIFADCGLGKTPMQLEWSRVIYDIAKKNILILAPLAVSMQTKREGGKFNINVNIASSQDDIQPGINITNYERLHLFDPDTFIGIVLDESSILKSFAGKIRNTIIEAFQSTKYKLACTATPSPNDYMELGNHSEFLGVMTRAEMLSMFFVHDGSRTSQWRLKGHAQDKFWEWMSQWAIMIRNPGDLDYNSKRFELPALNIKTSYVNAEIREGFLLPIPVTDLQDRRASRNATLQERTTRISTKVNADKSNKHLIWCNFNNESEMLKKQIPDAVEVKGSDSTEHKERSLLSFSNGNIRVLITKPKIAGFGMNWQACHNVWFCGLSDSYEQYYQAVRRCWRFGQTHPVDINVVVSESDEPVIDNVLRKEHEMQVMAENIVRHTKESIKQEIKGTKRDKEKYTMECSDGNNWKLHLGDCVEVLETMKANSVDYSIFSPPFASLYTYSNSERDMGNCKTNEEFNSHFCYIIEDLYRILKPGRNLSFHCMNLPTSLQCDGVIGLRDFRGELIRMFTDVGWIYHSEVCIWKDPVTAMQRTKALGLLHKQLKKDSCMSRQGVPDYLVTMRKPGENLNPVTHTNETYPVSKWQEIASPIWMDIRANNTLQKASARENNDERHICPLQLDVIERALELWSNPEDIVLSPFAGIGSEGVQSLIMDRRFVGIELKESYYRCACNNLAQAEIKKNEGKLFG